MTPEERSERSRLGGLKLRATHDPKQYTSKARKAFLDRFKPDDSTLTEEEKLRRAEAGLRFHMLQLSRRSRIARQKRKNNKEIIP